MTSPAFARLIRGRQRGGQLQLAALPAWQLFTNAVRSAPVSFLPSACLLHALIEVCLTGVALGAAGVAAGALAAKAAPQPRMATAARAAVIFIEVSCSNGDPAAGRSSSHVR